VKFLDLKTISLEEIAEFAAGKLKLSLPQINS
jgi:hypothetical protein